MNLSTAFLKSLLKSYFFMLLSAAVLSGEYYNITVFPKKQEVFLIFLNFLISPFFYKLSQILAR